MGCTAWHSRSETHWRRSRRRLAGVLEVAKENARRRRRIGRYHTKPGSAFDVDYGTGYDIVLLTNFLHHFDPATCENAFAQSPWCV